MHNSTGRVGKGSVFERLICKQLSEWWSKGQSDSIFYRTAGSGGRATRRGRKGKSTVNHCGDVQAADHSGTPFLNLCTVEIKRGYSSFSVHDVLDAPPPRKGGKPALQKWEEWFLQAEESAVHAGSLGWLVIARRDKRRTVAFMSENVFLGLHPIEDDREAAPLIVLYPRQGSGAVYGVRFEDLLAGVTPEDVKLALEANKVF